MFPIKNFSDIKSLIKLSKKTRRTEAPWVSSGESRDGALQPVVRGATTLACRSCALRSISFTHSFTWPLLAASPSYQAFQLLFLIFALWRNTVLVMFLVTQGWCTETLLNRIRRTRHTLASCLTRTQNSPLSLPLVSGRYPPLLTCLGVISKHITQGWARLNFNGFIFSQAGNRSLSDKPNGQDSHLCRMRGPVLSWWSLRWQAPHQACLWPHETGACWHVTYSWVLTPSWPCFVSMFQPGQVSMTVSAQGSLGRAGSQYSQYNTKTKIIRPEYYRFQRKSEKKSISRPAADEPGDNRPQESGITQRESKAPSLHLCSSLS